MRAITIQNFGAAEQLRIGFIADPEPKAEEVLIAVYATALNRADILQRQGKYPPPPGVSNIPGLEIAGKIIGIGHKVEDWKVGDAVFGLISGGGYAENAVIHQKMLMKIPEGFSFEDAAAIPEVFLTAYQALCWLSKIKTKEKLLIHAGGSGVGTAAIQLAKAMEATVFITASEQKHQACLNLGADFAYDYKKGPFQEWLLANTNHKGVDVIIDFIGGPYLEQNINCLDKDGRLVQLAMMGGKKVQGIDLGKVLLKRLNIIGSTLRSRSLEYQIKLTQEFHKNFIEKFNNRSIKPIIDKVFDWEDVQAAHLYMEANKNTGKIVLKIR